MDDSNKRRRVSRCQFGDQTAINQGNVQGNFTVNYSSPQLPAPKVIRVIPYPRNEDLVHREDLIDRLNQLLPHAGGSGSAALWGLGGTGKTQIALHYAYQRCIDGECSVFWVHADSEANFTSDYETIGKELELDDNLTGADLLDAVRRGIESRSKWLLVIDNADDLWIFGVGRPDQNSSLYNYVPHGLRGAVLWTSRDERIVGTRISPLRGIQVRSMAILEATELLATARGIPPASMSSDADVEALVTELECLPLAISQAGAFMRRMSISPQHYLNLLKEGP
ncbi:hypothetical protein F53441_3609 [Fusarium austroafricanum]|uniref:ORC1/DEAH AAA+ ATPase domain-containing protein n=1 Tax=Fusarium austroafricanum TaxID=2364996 RepID=A0A8H4P1M2_9HYPO|nr:hypothetical protein F53441_3609 [Fusarium austroafricanum]